MNLVKLSFLFLILPCHLTGQSFGTKDHPMNKSTSNMEMLTYWNNVSAKDTVLYKAALKVFASKKEASYADLLSDAEYLNLIEKQNIRILGGPLLGNLSESGISMWIRTSKASKIQIEYSLHGKSIVTEPLYSKVEKDLAVKFDIYKLKSDTRYTYRVIIDDSIKIENPNYYFATTPNKKVRIAFGSCPHRWGLGNEQLFKAIKSRNPAAMLLLGDIAVQDRNNNIAMHRADYLMRDFQTPWRNFACNIPVYAGWDDHDYFGNDRAGIPKGFTKQDTKNVWEIFTNSWANPAYGFGKQGQGTFFKSRIGPCDIIMTDNRYFRSGEKGSFLGDDQMNWFKKQLQNCEGPFIILSCGSMWSDFVSGGKDSWGVNDPEGREEIFQLIEEKNISGVLLISGDRHGARGFTIQRESGFKFYEFGAASMGARVGPPATSPKWTTQFYGIDDTFAFGEFTFYTQKGKEKLVFNLIHENESIIYSKSLSLKELTPNK